MRLDPELREELASRATAEGVSTSELIREALREYLKGRGIGVVKADAGQGESEASITDEPDVRTERDVWRHGRRRVQGQAERFSGHRRLASDVGQRLP